MRRTFLLFSVGLSKNDNKTSYKPRFRPRRLVMPVDPSDVHGRARSSNPLWAKYQDDKRLKKRAERRGALTLGIVPAERSVGDAFRLMLDVCEKNKFLDYSNCFTPKHLRNLENLLEMDACNASKDSAAHDLSLCSVGFSTTRDIFPNIRDDDGAMGSLSIRDADLMWQMLNNTPLDSPVHGVLAERGRKIVECVIARTAYEAFPRLRSKHLQAILHESCGLLPCGRVAVLLGFADMCGVSGEISMWRELNVLTERFNIARRKAASHRQRVEKGISQQRRWYWKAVLRSAAGRLKLFPVHQEDILPRMEWIRNSIFAFIAFMEIVENSGDDVKVEVLTKKLFCSQLECFARSSKILKKAEELVKGMHEDDVLSGSKNTEIISGDKGRIETMRLIAKELKSIRDFSLDELDVLDERMHPMNNRADNRRDQFASSGGAHSMQSLRDDIFDDYRVVRHIKDAPPVIIHSISPQNAFKEAQIILRYDPDVPSSLSESPIDVEQVIRKVTEVHETNPYASLFTSQQYRQVEYIVCKLYAGHWCIGEGKGETIMESMNEAAQHTLLNYYLRRLKTKINGNAGDRSLSALDDEKELNFPEVRVKREYDEEIIF